MKPPEISLMDEDATFQEIRKKAPFYLPEWDAEVDGDVGVTLSRIFSSMAGVASNRLNRALEKHFLSYLDMLDFSLAPARPARVPLTFVLSKGAPGNVLIGASSRASAKGPDGKPVFFETEKNILASPSNLASVYSVIKTQDEIFDHSTAVDGKDPSELFSGDSLQKHILYLGDEELFNLKEACIELSFEGADASIVKKLEIQKKAVGSGVALSEKLDIQKNLIKDPLRKELVSWEYAVEITEKKDGEEEKTIEWVPFKSVKFKTGEKTAKVNYPKIKLKTGPVIWNGVDMGFLPFSKAKVNGVESRWIRCRILESEIEEFADLKLSDIKIMISTPKDPVSEKSVMQVQGIGDIFYSKLAGEDVEHRIDTVEELLTLSADKLAACLQCSRIRAENILEAARKGFFDKTGIDDEPETGGIPQGIDPDFLFYNDIPIEVSREFYPFGSKPFLQDTFYIGSAGAFSKEGYGVTLNFELWWGSPSSTGDADIPRLSWEYWDGEGWIILVLESEQNLSKNTVCVSKISGHDGENTGFLGKNIAFEDENTGTLNADSSSELCSIEIPVMPEVKPSKVNGKESYWIRVRLVGGNYGKEYEISGNKVNPGSFCPPKLKDLKIDYSDTNGGKQPALVFCENNLTFRDCLKYLDTNENFKPFEVLPDAFPSVYLGFDREIKEGPFSLFMDIDELLEYPESFLPKVKWQYLAGENNESETDNAGEWKTLEVLDETGGFLKKGMLQFVAPEALKAASFFGSGKQYWIRAAFTGDFFSKELKPKHLSPGYKASLKRERPEIYRLIDARNLLLKEISNKYGIRKESLEQSINEMTEVPVLNKVLPEISRKYGIGSYSSGQNMNLGKFEIKARKPGKIEPEYFGPNKIWPDVPVSGAGEIDEINEIDEIKECRQTFEAFNIDFEPEEARRLPPKVSGFYFNSAWAIQASTYRDEILGSSRGEADQEFTLLHSPVFEESVWVDEYGALLEEERKNLAEEGLGIEEKKDFEGKTKESWVRWSRVDDFFKSGNKSRHYALDRTAGELRFGDGERGKVPPVGLENIKATYRSGGGTAGNLGELKISKLRASIAFVDSVYNPVPSGGGSDTEGSDSLAKRAPSVLKHRDRATAASDYEQLAREASSKVARVKVLSNFDSSGKFNTGWVTVAIIPNSTGKNPLPSGELKRSVKAYLEMRCPPILSLNVIAPVYVRVDVSAEILTSDLDAIPLIEKAALEKITAFLHPLTGSEEGKGWSFGEAPCISEIYSLLEGIGDVDHVAKVETTFHEGAKAEKLTGSSVIKLPEYALPYSGVHAISVKWTKATKEE